jgi:hypothetical protein
LIDLVVRHGQGAPARLAGGSVDGVIDDQACMESRSVEAVAGILARLPRL